MSSLVNDHGNEMEPNTYNTHLVCCVCMYVYCIVYYVLYIVTYVSFFLISTAHRFYFFFFVNATYFFFLFNKHTFRYHLRKKCVCFAYAVHCYFMIYLSAACTQFQRIDRSIFKIVEFKAPSQCEEIMILMNTTEF